MHPIPSNEEVRRQATVDIGETVAPDDPIMAVLLMLHREFAQNRSMRQDFEQQFEDNTLKVLKSIDTLNRLRKELLLELLNQNKQALDETEGRLYAAISAKVAREQQTQLADWWHGRQRWLLAATAVCAASSLASLMVLLAVLFK
ncbi:hypothetical protein [Paralysiella testudinis]|uniref:Uncharacterized protein n=1 Tax=Paralysiella testudinis TaxID=2809020 RepID=A0A892ZI70_9NEIS|nr:hypothetical protein [Paralysiella testudinis]QRQ82891.1 hypothetical protein JQU52_05825 [Paralysiella testudinis]